MTSGHRSALALAAAILLPVGAAQAASDRRPPSPLDDRIEHRRGGAISVLPRALESLPQSALTVNVNIPSSCNANWDGSEINMYGAGSNCNNTGENAGILVHEWGHGYDHNDGGGPDKPSEAYADIVAILAARDSCMGRGMYNDGSTCTGYGDTCLTCTGFPRLRLERAPAEHPGHADRFRPGAVPLGPLELRGAVPRSPTRSWTTATGCRNRVRR